MEFIQLALEAFHQRQLQILFNFYPLKSRILGCGLLSPRYLDPAFYKNFLAGIFLQKCFSQDHFLKNFSLWNFLPEFS